MCSSIYFVARDYEEAAGASEKNRFDGDFGSWEGNNQQCTHGWVVQFLPPKIKYCYCDFVKNMNDRRWQDIAISPLIAYKLLLPHTR